MSWDGIYRREPAGTDQPFESEQARQIQAKALRAFGSYAVPLGVTVNGRYDGPTAAFVEEYQRRKNENGYRPTLPANPNARPGDTDYATKVALGLIAGSNVNPPADVPGAVAYSVPGTWGIWNDGPNWWTCTRLDGRRFFAQGVQWNTGAFLTPDPTHSYVEARNEGTGELLRLALPDPRPKVVIGYSMGADVVTRFLLAWPAERRGEIRLVVKFGDPGKVPGSPGGASAAGGISRVWTPEWARDRTISYQINGDMYGDAPGLLPFFYEILTRMEASGEFLFYLFGLLTGIPVGSGLGGILGGLGGLLGPAGGILGGLGGSAIGGPLGGILGGLGGGILGNLGGGILGGGTANPPAVLGGSQPAAPANALGQQLLGLAGAAVPGFGGLSGLLGLITPGPTSSMGGPISLAAMLLNLPAIIQTLMAALEFLFTQAHGKYGGSESLPIFNGVDAVIDAANRINGLRI